MGRDLTAVSKLNCQDRRKREADTVHDMRSCPHPRPERTEGGSVLIEGHCNTAGKSSRQTGDKITQRRHSNADTKAAREICAKAIVLRAGRKYGQGYEPRSHAAYQAAGQATDNSSLSGRTQPAGSDPDEDACRYADTESDKWVSDGRDNGQNGCEHDGNEVSGRRPWQLPPGNIWRAVLPDLLISGQENQPPLGLLIIPRVAPRWVRWVGMRPVRCPDEFIKQVVLDGFPGREHHT